MINLFILREDNFEFFSLRLLIISQLKVSLAKIVNKIACNRTNS